MIEIIFCDISKKFTDSCEKLIKKNPRILKYYKLSTYHGSIIDLTIKNAAYISPANSFGSMGGGIDEIYNKKMFPDIQKEVMNNISKLPNQAKSKITFDRLKKDIVYNMLPIGDAIITPLSYYSKYTSCYLITAPTMVQPESIEGSDNPYKAFLACLNIIKSSELKISTIICPGLGTGVGCIEFDESAKQIFDAINTFISIHE